MGFVLFVELGDCCGQFEIKKLDNDCDVIEIQFRLKSILISFVCLNNKW